MMQLDEKWGAQRMLDKNKIRDAGLCDLSPRAADRRIK